MSTPATFQLDHSDALMDISAELVINPTRRDNAMLKAHKSGCKACEICGQALNLAKASSVSFGSGEPTAHVGPECAKRMIALGYVTQGVK